MTINPAKAKSSAKSKAVASVSHEAATIAMFRDDPELASEYLNQVLADGSQEELLLGLRYLTAAFGGVAGIAQSTQLNARTLYCTLSERENPELDTLSALLKAKGLRLAVAPIVRRPDVNNTKVTAASGCSSATAASAS